MSSGSVGQDVEILSAMIWTAGGRRIRELRGFNITQDEFAQRIGSSQSFLLTVERRRVEVRQRSCWQSAGSLISRSSGFSREKGKCELVSSRERVRAKGIVTRTRCLEKLRKRQVGRDDSKLGVEIIRLLQQVKG